jgi:hypothetical protein
MPAAVEEVVVAGRGQVGNAFRGDFVDRRGHRAVLEERLFKPGDVVDDHVGARAPRGDRAGEAFDVLGEGFFAFEGGGEGEVCVRREVVEDLQHRPPLVAGFLSGSR